jgi:putative oxidoreductase
MKRKLDMKKSQLIARVLLGLMMLIFGFNKILQFMLVPPLPDQAMAFMVALFGSGYLMTLIAIIEIVVGITLLANKFVAISLVVLYPVMLNAFLFHLFLDIGGIGMALVAFSLNTFAMLNYKEVYKPIFRS